MPPKAHGTRQAAKRPRAEAEEEEEEVKAEVEEVKEEEEAEEEAAGVEEKAAEAAEEKAFVPKRKKQAVKRPPSRPAASTAARKSKPVAAPARKPAPKPVRKPGKILKGLTDPIFIAVPEFDHLLAYNSIRGVLDRKGIADDNKSWKDMIKYKFKGMGEDPLILDLDSSPWAKNPRLLASARKRTGKLEWKWRKVINERDIAEAREANDFPAQPFSKVFREAERKYRESKKKAGKKSNAEEEEGQDEDDVDE